MRPVYVTQLHVVTALGEGLERNWTRLTAGESAVAPIERFDPGAWDCRQAACLAGLHPDGLGNLTGALMARAIEPLAGGAPVPPQTPVIWAGIKGQAEAVEYSCDHASDDCGVRSAECGSRSADCGPPSLNPNPQSSIVNRQSSIPNPQSHMVPPMPYRAEDYRRWIEERMGLEGGGVNVNAACASSAVALALGASWIASGKHEQVLICAADCVSRFVHVGFAALRGLSAATCRPFDRRRDGLVLGDGAVSVLLAGRPGLGGREPLARLAGWAVANDATHITAPARDGAGLRRAILEALESAELEAGAVGAWCAHGTGTLYNDAMELTALESVFGPRRFPVFSLKGAIGHTLGAAGAIEAAVSVRALREKTVPPTAGFDEPETGAAGRVAVRCQPFDGRTILSTNSGFGGINAALVFRDVGEGGD